MAVLLTFAVTMVAQAETKIAVVDMARLIKAHPKTAEDRATLEKQAEEYRDEQRAMLEKLNGLKKDYLQAREESQSKALSETARAEKREALEDKRIALLEYEREIRSTLSRREKQLAQQERRMLDRIVERIQKEITAYTKGKGYTLILDRSATSVSGVQLVLHAAAEDDITEAVLGRFETTESKTGE
jgi:outer membrane protein